MLPRRAKCFVSAVIIVLAVSACGGGGKAQPAAVPQTPEHALAGLAAQHVAVLPTYAVVVAPGLDWGSAIGRPGELQRTLDTDIIAAFEERGLPKTWVFPPALQRSYRRNSTYAADPYALAEEPLRSNSLVIDGRLSEPLASQIRTLVALHENVRLVLAPVELRLEKSGTNMGRGVLRLVLLDARMANVRWIGQVASDSVETFGPKITASLAARLAGVVAPH